MAYTGYFPSTSGNNLYAKARPLNVTWSTGVVTLTENSTTGEYSASTLADETIYAVYRRLGGSPASSDLYLGDINPPSTADVAAIKAKTDLIGTGTAIVSAPVSGDGDLLELIIGDDYLADNGRALEWTFDAIVDFTVAAVGKFGLVNSEDATEVYLNSTGDVTEVSSGVWKVSFDIPADALTSLTPGYYDWSVSIEEDSVAVTVSRNRQNKTRVKLVEKQT